MLDHTQLHVSDPKRSRTFYDKALAALGYEMLFEVPAEHTGGVVCLGYGAGRPQFWMIEGTPEKPHVHLALVAETRKQVDEFYRAALAAGGKDNGAPGPRPHYHKDYYGAFVWDPDGHNIEAVCRKPS